MSTFSEAIKTLRALLPKKSISSEYAEIVELAAGLSAAQVEDIASNRKRAELPIDQEKMINTMESLFAAHIQNQIRLFEAKNG